MRFALLADIHANREAFEAVLADLTEREVDRIIILGDLVGYGPDPEWCVDRAMALVADGALAIRGNHDEAICAGAGNLNVTARRVIAWTRGRLSALHTDFLAGLPILHREGEMLFVHASANAPEDWNYVTGPERARASFAVCNDRFIFVGHRHVPDLFSCDVSGHTARLKVGTGCPMPLLPSRRWLAVIGSVGQPRGGIAKAAYALLDTAGMELTFRHVPYNTMRTVEKLREYELPESLAIRLNWGV